MKCSDVRKLLPGLALGDLDAEPARAAADHLKSCAECRGAQSEVAATVAALGNAEPLGPSAARREAAAAAMARAQAELAERLLVRQPRRGRLWSAAAALVLASLTVFLWPSGELELKVAQVSGRADLYDARSRLWSRISQGDLVRVNDRLLTGNEAVVRLDFKGGTLWVNQNSSVAFVPGRRLVLDRGDICAELPSATRELAVTDTVNTSRSVRRGRLEAGLREMRRLVGGHAQPKHGDANPPPEPKVEVTYELVSRMTDLSATDVAPWRAPGYHGQKK